MTIDTDNGGEGSHNRSSQRRGNRGVVNAGDNEKEKESCGETGRWREDWMAGKGGMRRQSSHEVYASIASRISEADDACRTWAIVGRDVASSTSAAFKRKDRVDILRSC
jgi:hypothetical protein